MFEPRVLAALAAGSTVVTPNKRLARALVARYDADQHAIGHRAWPAVRALPWTAWQDALWSDVLACDALPSIARRLDAAAADWCWKRIVVEDGAPLFDPGGAAALAADAWALLKSWGAGGESWRGWQRDAGEDQAAFVRWAERFHARVGRMDAIDAASIADSLARAAPDVAAWCDLDIVLAGFVEMSPQQERLVAALARHGAKVTRVDTLAPDPSRVMQTPHRLPTRLGRHSRGRGPRRSRTPAPRSVSPLSTWRHAPTKFARLPTTSSVRRCSSRATKGRRGPTTFRWAQVSRVFRLSAPRST